MRDPRFIAAHRGGPLDLASHRFLATWAADCAESVLPFFQQSSDDVRPLQAIEIARQWAKGEVKTGVAMKASVAAHAAARLVADKAAIAAARAAGQAVATAHFADHCMGGLLYALKALEVMGQPAESELDFQLSKLPGSLRTVVVDGLIPRLKGLGIRARLPERRDVR
jgi:hypothetical protein